MAANLRHQNPPPAEPAAVARHIDDADVQDKAEEAAAAACRVLDAMFPGYDNGGITSNFNGHLKDVLLHMLAGRSVLQGSISLPQLVLTDASFGREHSGAGMFLVARIDHLEWVRDASPPGGWCEVPRVLVLNDLGTRFVARTDVDNIDPFISYGDAVQGAVNWLRASGAAQAQAKLLVVPTAASEEGYVLGAGDSLALPAPAALTATTSS